MRGISKEYTEVLVDHGRTFREKVMYTYNVVYTSNDVYWEILRDASLYMYKNIIFNLVS